jgi:hypothetical protein
MPEHARKRRESTSKRTSSTQEGGEGGSRRGVSAPLLSALRKSAVDLFSFVGFFSSYIAVSAPVLSALRKSAARASSLLQVLRERERERERRDLREREERSKQARQNSATTWGKCVHFGISFQNSFWISFATCPCTMYHVPFRPNFIYASGSVRATQPQALARPD